MKPRGLYELLLTKALAELLTQLPDRLEPVSEPLRSAEAADRIALHLGRAVQKALEDVPEAERVKAGVDLVDRLLQQIGANRPDLLAEAFSGSVLRAIAGRLPDGSREVIPQPLIPLLDTALLTNAPGEPRVGSQVLAEMHSADRIDVVMAFIRRSGIAPLVGALRTHCSAGRGAASADDDVHEVDGRRRARSLRDLGADVRVSYDVTGTRLHAKSWLFHRASGFSTAYIGSSNLTHSAQVTGLEWNVRVSGARNPDVVDKVAAVFESYWNGGDFIPYDARRVRSADGSSRMTTTITFVHEPDRAPARALPGTPARGDRALRERGHHRNLLASATGTGKTVMAAIDYARLRERLPRARLLFVAHRKEILEQSLSDVPSRAARTRLR